MLKFDTSKCLTQNKIYDMLGLAKQMNVIIELGVNPTFSWDSKSPDFYIHLLGSDELNRGFFNPQNKRIGKGRNPLTDTNRSQRSGGARLWLKNSIPLTFPLRKKVNQSCVFPASLGGIVALVAAAQGIRRNPSENTLARFWSTQAGILPL